MKRSLSAICWQKIFAIAAALMFFSVLGACSDAPDAPDNRVIRVGILPDQNEATLRAQYGALLSHIAEHSGHQIELVIPSDYADLVAKFEAGQIDLGYFGGVTFLQVEQSVNAVPLVMRDVDREFTSVFIARSDSGSEKIEDFKAQRLSFGSRLSTSGHLMPRHFLAMRGINLLNYFSDMSYSGSHDKTAFRVRDGEVDLGAMNGPIYDGMIESGRLAPDELKVVWRTPPYADYVWAASSSLSDENITKLRDGFLDLLPDDSEHAEILEKVGAGYFLPASLSDFHSLRVVAAQLGIIAIAEELGLAYTDQETRG